MVELMPDARTRLRRLILLLRAARVREATALRELGAAISAEADASARRNRILSLLQDTTPLMGAIPSGSLAAGAQLRSLLAPAQASAAVEIEAAARRRVRAQQAVESARARCRRLADSLTATRREADAETERFADPAPRRLRA
ncbi:hypothetical protein FJQ54_12100 [Sandaracinobacter neustonicus]|uniref:Flagellar FliJ protein n=1 Tax=Sandaracinobacter neustonicus TaxID=1715348 RepID=A0A501XI35_9SPHN|nr:hypothetical protein [Sandaracinobacter neustonicus]TPE60145.1 hypothetical protein FJQ54_12100 [Sandaracinobacter neustonicus]